MSSYRTRAVCSALLALQLLARACAQMRAAHSHGGPAVTPAGTLSAAQVGAVEALQHGLFRAHYELPLRPMRPGEVAITSPATTLLAHPAGRVAIVDWTFDLVYAAANGSSVPLNALYNHHASQTFDCIIAPCTHVPAALCAVRGARELRCFDICGRRRRRVAGAAVAPARGV